MDKMFKDLLDAVDLLMISLHKQKQLGMDASVIEALRNITKVRNAYRKNLFKVASQRDGGVEVALPVKIQKMLKTKKIKKGASTGIDFPSFLDQIAKRV